MQTAIYVSYIFKIKMFLSGAGFEDIHQNKEHEGTEDF